MADGGVSHIVSLRSPSDTLIRALDAHTYWPVTESKQNGTFEGLDHTWQAANEYLIQVATKYHIPVARVHEAFNGSNGDEVPREKGANLMAELVRELGYEYAP